MLKNKKIKNMREEISLVNIVLSIEGEKDKAVAKCIHCKKEFPLKEIPSTTLCRK